MCTRGRGLARQGVRSLDDRLATKANCDARANRVANGNKPILRRNTQPSTASCPPRVLALSGSCLADPHRPPSVSRSSFPRETNPRWHRVARGERVVEVGGDPTMIHNVVVHSVHRTPYGHSDDPEPGKPPRRVNHNAYNTFTFEYSCKLAVAWIHTNPNLRSAWLPSDTCPGSDRSFSLNLSLSFSLSLSLSLFSLSFSISGRWWADALVPHVAFNRWL